MRTNIYSFLVVALLLAPTNLTAANSEQDRETAQTVASNLKSSGLLKDYRVGVKYEDGVAWLTGTVTSDKQKATAEQIARRSAGVEQVVSKLTIGPGMKSNVQLPETKKAKSKVTKARQPIVDASVKPATNRRARVGKGQQTILKRRPSRPRQPMAGHRTRNNSPRPYARVAQDPRMAQQARDRVQQTRGGQGVRPASYGGPVMGMGAGGPMMAGGSMGTAGPMPAGGGQAVSYDNPQMPGYAWPSYAANPNYAALTYPKQYSPSAWPYIGPFYPYPQVPLGWRKVTLEWDDGWWFLDFKDCKDCR